jgi:hypothetical protein
LISNEINEHIKERSELKVASSEEGDSKSGRQGGEERQNGFITV